MNIVEDMDAVDVAMKRWLGSLDPNVVAFQPSDNKDVKEPHIIFYLINLASDDYTCDTYSLDVDGNPQHCTVLEHRMTYQVDVLHCPYGFNLIMRMLSAFKSGKIREHGSYNNFSFTDDGVMRRVPFYRHTTMHWKATIDLDFLLRFRQCNPVNTIERVDITACADAPDLPDITFIKP